MKSAPVFVATTLALAASFAWCVAPADAQLKPKKPEEPAAVDVDDRIKKIFDDEKLHYDVTGAGVFKLVFNVGGDGAKRSQLVFVNSQTETYGDFEIREVWSIAKKAPEKSLDAAFYRRLLEDNQVKKLGGWSIITTEGQDYAIFTVKIAADVDAKNLKDVIEVVLETADEREKAENNGEDEF